MNRYDLTFDSRVNGHDKPFGRLQKVVVDAATQEVTHLVISAGRLFKQAVVLPLSLVESITDPREIQLSVYSDESNKLPVYNEMEDEAVVLSAATAVSSLDNDLGHLSHVITDAASGCIVQLVVTRGKRPPQNLVVPIAKISKLDEQMIQVAATGAEVDEFSEYAVGQRMSATAKPEPDNISSEKETAAAIIAQQPEVVTVNNEFKIAH